MNCEQFELELMPGQLGADAKAHAAQCERCSQTLALFQAASPAELSLEQNERLTAIAREVSRAPRKRELRARRFWGYALAAGLGAAAAVGVLRPSHAPAPTSGDELASLAVEVPWENELTVDDDAVEVAWPETEEAQ